MPLNPELPDDVKNKAELFVMQHSVAIADVGLVIALAVAFTILGTPLVSLINRRVASLNGCVF